jgi:hypothetical protein
MAELVIGAVFAVWWALSACNQFRSGAWTLPMRRHIPLGLIPSWTFFAPNPARADSRLIWREQHGDGWCAWRELHFGFAPVRSRWLINTELIENKAITDLVGSLQRIRADRNARDALLSSPYVALLNIVVDQPRRTRCTAVQFAIVRTSRIAAARRVDIIFLSEIHDLEDASIHVH